MENLRALLPDFKIDSESFWSAIDEQRLELSRCESCKHLFFYPRIVCPNCGAQSIVTIVSKGFGVIHSFTHVHFSPRGNFWEEDVPYTVALVDLDEGPRLLSRLVGDDCVHVEIGDAVQVEFPLIENSQHRLPVFRRFSETTDGGGMA